MSTIWRRAPFERFFEYVHELDRILYLCFRGVHIISNSVPLAEALHDLHALDHPGELSDSRESVERAKADAAFAEKELKKDFPVLHAHTLVALWGALETLFHDVVVAHLIQQPMHLKHSAFAKISMPISEFEGSEPAERMHFVVRELERMTRADFRRGVERFEALLKPLSLDGTVAEDIRRTMFEMQQIRHVIVHRRSVADRTLVRECPWLDVKVGDHVRVRHADYHRFGAAAAAYVVDVLHRIRDRVLAERSAEASSEGETPERANPEEQEGPNLPDEEEGP